MSVAGWAEEVRRMRHQETTHLILIGFSLFVSPVVQAQEASVTPSVTYETQIDSAASTWVPYDDKTAGILHFRGMVSGRPVEGVVDTGVTITALDAGFASAIAPSTKAEPSIAINATGGSAGAGRGPTIDLHMTGVQATGLQTLTSDLSGFANAVGKPVDVMVGLNLIGWGTLDLDLGEKRWRLGPSGVALPKSYWAPLRYTDDHYYSFVSIAVAGRTLRLFVDTGYDGGLMLTSAAAQATKLAGDAPVTTIAVAGVGGTTAMRMVLPRRLRFAETVLPDVPVYIDDGQGLPTKLGFDGMIGTALLGKLRVVLDYPAGVMAYQLSSHPSEPPRRTTIGVQLIPTSDRLTVAHAMAGSPAALTGWKAGDSICAVNGVRVAPGQDRKWNFARSGTQVRFEMCDGTFRILTASNFY